MIDIHIDIININIDNTIIIGTLNIMITITININCINTNP